MLTVNFLREIATNFFCEQLDNDPGWEPELRFTIEHTLTRSIYVKDYQKQNENLYIQFGVPSYILRYFDEAAQTTLLLRQCTLCFLRYLEGREFSENELFVKEIYNEWELNLDLKKQISLEQLKEYKEKYFL